MLVVRIDYEFQVKVIKQVLTKFVQAIVTVGCQEGENDHMVAVAHPLMEKRYFEEMSDALERVFSKEGLGLDYEHTRAGATANRGTIRIALQPDVSQALKEKAIWMTVAGVIHRLVHVDLSNGFKELPSDTDISDLADDVPALTSHLLEDIMRFVSAAKAAAAPPAEASPEAAAAPPAEASPEAAAAPPAEAAPEAAVAPTAEAAPEAAAAPTAEAAPEAAAAPTAEDASRHRTRRGALRRKRKGV